MAAHVVHPHNPVYPPHIHFHFAAPPLPSMNWVPQHATVTWSPLPQDPEPPRDLFHERWRTFHPFSHLPIELRLKIWAYTCPGRVIELRSWGDRTTNAYIPIKFSAARHDFPILLHVNQESRREGLRFYKLVDLGVSTSALDPRSMYVPWEFHPYNSNGLGYRVRGGGVPLALPFQVQKLYLDFSQDIIYFGPEFKLQHLKSFLTTKGQGTELADVQHLAIDRKMWTAKGVQPGRPTFHADFEFLREALYSLSRRPLKTLYIIPDDEPNHLADALYYRKHDITLHTPPYRYEFSPDGKTSQGNAKTVVDNLEEWMERLWMGKETPKIEIMSVRRKGRRMNEFKPSIWEVQRVLGDMAAWKTWLPHDP